MNYSGSRSNVVACYFYLKWKSIFLNCIVGLFVCFFWDIPLIISALDAVWRSRGERRRALIGRPSGGRAVGETKGPIVSTQTVARSRPISARRWLLLLLLRPPRRLLSACHLMTSRLLRIKKNRQQKKNRRG